MAERFTWVPAYEAIATRLLEYEDRQDVLAAIVESEVSESHDRMDPLTFLSMFNGKLRSIDNRQRAVSVVLDRLGIDAQVPVDFDGIPINNPQNWRFWGGNPNDIESNWSLFKRALAYADMPSQTTHEVFIEAFDEAHARHNIGDANLTMALFWARPSVFLPLDNNTTTYLRNRYGLSVVKLDGAKYLKLIDDVREKTGLPFVEISYSAWQKAGWIPAPYEYDPGITVEQLTECLRDPSIGKPTFLTAIKCLNEHPKGATCTELSEFYGRTAEFYNANVSSLAEAIASRLGISPREVETSGGKWWPVLCYGSYVRKRRHGTFEWRLRDEVREALKTLDLGYLPLRESEDIPVPSFDPERLKRLVKLYKKDFYSFRGPDGEEGDRETYKWNDLLAYRRNWKLDATDLPAMITASLKPSATGSGALLASGYEYPYDRLLKLSAFDPEAFREAFRKLYDPNSSLRIAYSAFSRDMDELLQRYDTESETPLDRDYQEPKAASVYLFFEKPERYHIYKYSFAGSFAKAIGAELPNDQLERFYQYEALCDVLVPLVTSDAELLALGDSVLTQEQRDADPAHHLLLQDIAYYADRYIQDWNPDWEKALSGEEDIVIPRHDEPVVAPSYPKNQILFGPPGTGKTFQTRAYAVAICDGREVEDVKEQMKTAEGRAQVAARYRELKDGRRIVFTTFHQSYGYEEFIEGIRPAVVKDDSTDDSTEGGIVYKIEEGVFKKFCKLAASPDVREEAIDFGFNDAPSVWKVSLEGTGDNPTRTECLANGHIRIGWDDYGPSISDETDFAQHGGKTVLNAFYTKMRVGDIVMSCYSSTTIDAIGVITGDVEWHDEYAHYKRLRKVRWIAKGLKDCDIVERFGIPTLTLSTVYKLKLDATDVVSILDELGLTKRKVQRREALPYVFIIDEINRGNVSKVFGELITLLEEDKRQGEEMETTAKLPYSDEDFCIPSNVYLIGTMNTADRSIAHMDTALRRRFSFKEIMPDPSLFEGIEIEGIDIEKMLSTMNDRIEMLYDRDHTLGHAIFISLLSEENRIIKVLRDLFRDKVIPLLQEYFFDDYGKICSVLGAAGKDFIEVKEPKGVFWKGDREEHTHLRAYGLKNVDTLDAAAFQRIYQIERGE